MSNYCTLWDAHGDNDTPEEGSPSPYRYRGSHLPVDPLDRDGYVEVAAVAPHLVKEGGGRYVRLGVCAAVDDNGCCEGETVILDRQQVGELVSALVSWLVFGIEEAAKEARIPEAAR